MGTSCGCCGGCCICDRLIKNVVVTVGTTPIEIPINKTIKELDCYHPIYIGDAVSTWRYEQVGSASVYMRSFYKSVEILIDFLDPALLSPFKILKCENIPSVYRMGVSEKQGSKWRLFWPDERFLKYSSIILEYKGKSFTITFYSSLDINLNQNYIKDQITNFANNNSFPELLDVIVTLKLENMAPADPILNPIVLREKTTLEQFEKNRYTGSTVRDPYPTVWNKNRGYGIYEQALVYGTKTYDESWLNPSIPKTELSNSYYTFQILGFFIELEYGVEYGRLKVESSMNFIYEVEKIADFKARNNLPKTIKYIPTHRSCHPGSIQPIGSDPLGF